MSYYEQVGKIESLLIRFCPENAIAIQNIIGGNPDLENEFLRQLRSPDWFNWLKKTRYFEPSNIPYDIKGNALFWNILAYLERVSEQLNKEPQYGKELIGILETIYQFSQNKKPINNLHIWWYCSKILNNIPIDIIKVNLPPAKFRSWLLVWAEHSSLVISDIGEKLLPKFLKEDTAINYAEVIIDVLTEVRIPEIPYKDAILAWDNYWVREAFKKNPKIGEKCSLEAIFNIADKLKKVMEYKQQVQYDITQINGEYYRIEASRVVDDSIKPGEIGFKEGVYNCSVKQYSKDQTKDIVQSTIWTLHNVDPATHRSEPFQIIALNKNDFILKIISGLPKEINWASVGHVLNMKMGLLFDNLNSDYSWIHFKSLQNVNVDIIHSAEEVLTVIFRDVLLAKCKANPEEGKLILKAFLSDKYAFPLFKRYVLLCTDKQWSDYKGLFDIFINLIPTAFENASFEVELYDLLRNHNSDFEQPLLENLHQLISKVPEYYKEKGEKLSVYWQFKWISPLKDNPAFSDRYKEIEKKIEPKVDKPYEPERATITSWFIGSKSPKTVAEILKMPVSEIVKSLNEFKGVDHLKSFFEDGPDKEGFAGALFEAIKEQPNKFVDGIESFYGVEDFYLIHLFRGIREAWKANKDFDWEKVFGLFFKLNEQTQAESIAKERNTWLISEIVGLIEDGCSNDSHAFDPRLFEKADKTFNLIIPTLKGEEKPNIERDALMYAMNTTLGLTIMAFVSFSLRVARVVKKSNDAWSINWIQSWGNNKYERFFSKGIEAHIWFGGYLPQIKYLDVQYSEKKINEISKIDMSDYNWRMFMEGYIHGGNVYEDLYKLMRSNCLRALDKKDFNEEVNHRLVEYVCLGYLHFKELLEKNNVDGQESLFWKMLFGENTFNQRERWLRVADYFGSRNASKRVFDDKIIAFWKWTYDNNEKVKTILGDDYNSFLGKMSALVNILDKIDDERKSWLLLCAPYVNLHHNAMSFMEYLTKFDDADSVKYIGEIFRKVLENTTPQFMEENIKKVVRKIYEKGDCDVADEICNTYGRRGVHFLKPLWEEFQGKK